MTVLRFSNSSMWTGSDGCNDMAGNYRLGRVRAFQLVAGQMTAVACSHTPTPESLAAAVRVELLHGRLTFFAHDGHELAQYERATVTARVVLPSTTMTAGSSMSGHLIVENNTGHVLHALGCISYFAVALNNARIHQGAGGAQCIEGFTFPVGESSYSVTVQATYFGCGGTPLGTNPPCLTHSGHTILPPLPPGNYQAKLFQSGNVVPTPPSITVRVTP